MTKLYDTILGEYLQKPWERWLSLDSLAERKLDYHMLSYDELTNKWKIPFEEIELSRASNYSAEDVYITAKLYKQQKENWLSNNKILNDIEIPLIEVLKTMELSWVKIDKEKLEKIGKKLRIEIENAKIKVHTLAGEEFNINSPKQVGSILFEKQWIPTAKKTKTGYSVDNEVLENLAKTYPIAKHILEYRWYTKLLSTYVEWLLSILDKEDKIHTSYNQTVTTTGRLSSTNPNLQNIPIWEWLSSEIREAFIPYEKWDIIMASDYSQVEVRLLAIMSGDSNLLWAFEEGVDIHTTTANFIFAKDDISWAERKIAKAVNFGVIYGISPFGLSKIIWVPQKEAKIYIDKFFDRYSRVKEFFEETIIWCEKNWYVETMFGRRRYIPSINDRNNNIKKTAEREAINMPVQGTAADIIKLAMIKVHNFLQSNNLKSRMIMQVHDELVFNVKKEELDIIKSGVKEIMEWVLSDAPITLTVDIWLGNNWREAH